MNHLLKPLSQIHNLPFLKPISDYFKSGFSEADLEGFRRAQRLAYDCAKEIGKLLRPGWSEKQTADLMDTYLRDHGIQGYFHRSFAWFGERTRFDNMRHYLDFLPGERVYQGGDEVVILDTAPVLNGYAADIGYSFCVDTNPQFDQALITLKSCREDILELFSQPNKQGDAIYREIDLKLEKQGYDNCHQRYPLGALGHRLYKMPFTQVPGLLIPFSWQSYFSMMSQGLFSEVLGKYHGGDLEGLWAIEPHLGANGFGIKFEEMLWVKEGKAQWLDEAQFYDKSF